jgi:tetratricopeptide (TPR) repeat protein
MRRHLSIRTLCHTAIAFAAIALVGGYAHLGAEMTVVEAENVPTERVIANLERRLANDPSDVLTRINLARAHAIAWATKSGTQWVRASGYESARAGDPAGSDTPNGSFQYVRVATTRDPALLKAARDHLAKAIATYRAALQRDPSSVSARLGLAWCQDQAGEKAEAIAGYREVLKAVWPADSARNAVLSNGPVPTTTEVAAYLLRLLDPIADAAEIATLKSHVNQMNSLPRWITPLVVPLHDDVALRDLMDPKVRVLFDADGSGIPRRWTWIRPRAGWLVFDRHGKGRITSALQGFGSVTFWLFWRNGYEALRSLDDNGDGTISGRELQGVAIWNDENANGVSEPGEVRPATSWGIVALSCAHVVSDDAPTLAAWSPTGVTFTDGRTRPTYDVLLYPR